MILIEVIKRTFEMKPKKFEIIVSVIILLYFGPKCKSTEKPKFMIIAECRKIDLQYGYVFIHFLKEGGISNCW